MIAVLRIEHGAAARGQNHTVELRKIVDNLGLALAKSCFTFFFEDEWDIHAGTRLNLLIAVDEFEMQHARKLPADG